jgi:hypothetical protein
LALSTEEWAMSNKLLVSAGLFGVSASLSAGGLGCGPSPMEPRYVEVVPVPADRVVSACACDDDDEYELVLAPRPVEYVPLEAWQAPPAVQRFEASAPPRGPVPASYVSYPRLTLHEPIPDAYVSGPFWRSGRARVVR